MKDKNTSIIALILLIVFISGCAGPGKENISSNQAPIGQIEKNRIATIITDKGVIKFELFEKKAPNTTANFIKLAESGFYNNLTFHRVEPGFVIQGGDPLGTGMGGSNKTIPLEINPELKHTKGAVGMARSTDPDSASSQFYITLSPLPGLDGKYAVFGQVIQGQDVVEKIRKGDKMQKITIGEK